jgi:hypothetical protein
MATPTYIPPFGALVPDILFFVVALIVTTVMRYGFRARLSVSLAAGVILFLALGVGLSFIPVETHTVKFELPK